MDKDLEFRVWGLVPLRILAERFLHEFLFAFPPPEI